MRMTWTARSPIMISNTYHMDRCLGWRGICVEANPRYLEKLHRERSCALVPTCVSERDGARVDFALSGPGSGVTATHRQGKHFLQGRGGAGGRGDRAAPTVTRLRCTSLKSVLRRYGVRRVHYLNVDVEGHEMAVLRGMEWEAVRVDVISVEVAPKTEGEIDTFLRGKGFERLDNEEANAGMPGVVMYPSNRFYVHESVEFGRPR